MASASSLDNGILPPFQRGTAARPAAARRT
jgi:hypothetical protein